MKFNEKVINESGKVSTYLQSHAEVSHRFISTGLWSGDHKSSLFLLLFAKAVDFPTVWVTAGQLRNVTCSYSLLQATAKFPKFQ
jgi:hypothetical protein